MSSAVKPKREHIHTRKINCKGYKREDGLWDIEVDLKDVRTFSIENSYRGGYIHAGEPVHGMGLRLALDIEFKIHEVEVHMKYIPEQICGTIVDGMQQLVGLQIKPGWMKEVREKVGGTAGCTHLLELLGPLGTTAYQTMFREVEAFNQEHNQHIQPRVINSCVTWASNSKLVKDRWPIHYQEATRQD